MNFISLKQAVNRLGSKKTWIPAFAGMTSIYMQIINPYDNRAPSQNLRRSCPDHPPGLTHMEGPPPPMSVLENFSEPAQTGIRPGFTGPPKYSETDIGGPLPVRNKEG